MQGLLHGLGRSHDFVQAVKGQTIAIDVAKAFSNQKVHSVFSFWAKLAIAEGGGGGEGLKEGGVTGGKGGAQK